MASFTSTLGDLLGALSQSFRLSVYFPALVFVVLNAFTLEPYLNQTLFYKVVASSELLLAAALITLALGVAYALSVLNIPLTQLYEGYAYRDTWLGRRMTMLHFHRKELLEEKAQELNSQANLWEGKFQVLQDDVTRRGLVTRALWRAYGAYQNASSKRDRVNDELLRFYPADEKRILPTRLGNVFANFEDYPRQLYSMDSVLLWPRMVPALIQSKYGELIEREKMGFDFFLNISFLSFLFALSYSASNLYFTARLNMWVPMIAVLCGWLAYRFAIMAAQNFGVSVRVAFDLHRKALRETLGMQEPSSFEEETAQWRFLGQLLVEPDRLETWKKIFKYPLPKEDSAPDKGEAST